MLFICYYSSMELKEELCELIEEESQEEMPGTEGMKELAQLGKEIKEI